MCDKAFLKKELLFQFFVSFFLSFETCIVVHSIVNISDFIETHVSFLAIGMNLTAQLVFNESLEHTVLVGAKADENRQEMVYGILSVVDKARAC